MEPELSNIVELKIENSSGLINGDLSEPAGPVRHTEFDIKVSPADPITSTVPDHRPIISRATVETTTSQHASSVPDNRSEDFIEKIDKKFRGKPQFKSGF